MIIAVNTRLLLHDRLEGIGRFAHETLRIITRQNPGHKFIFIFDRGFNDEFVYSDNIIPVKGWPPARHPFLWRMFFDYYVPGVLKKYKADIFLSPDGWLSLRTNVRSLPVIHDINFFRHPEFIPGNLIKYYNRFFPQFVRKASRIATVSEFSRDDISDYFNLDKSLIDVVYNAAGDIFTPLATPIQQAVREKFSGGMPYFIFTGLIHPRKNIPGLIKAYGGFRDSSGSNIKLLIAGEMKWRSDDLDSALKSSSYKDDIIFTGRVSDENLRKLTASAFAMVYVSFFEGFGLPVLEAMKCDVPVIASNTSALPGTGGDVVLYADPFSVDSIKDSMLALYRNEKLRNALINKARTHRQKYSWQRTADLLWESIEKTAFIK